MSLSRAASLFSASARASKPRSFASASYSADGPPSNNLPSSSWDSTGRYSSSGRDQPSASFPSTRFPVPACVHVRRSASAAPSRHWIPTVNGPAASRVNPTGPLVQQLQCCPLHLAADRTTGNQEVDSQQFDDKPADILARGLELRRELLREVQVSTVDRIDDDALPEIVEIRRRPYRSVLKSQRTGLEQACLFPVVDERVDQHGGRAEVNVSCHERILKCRSR